MAGSYRHVVDSDGSFRGTDLIDNVGDAHEALEEMYDMINYLADQIVELDPAGLDRRHLIHEAWRYGHSRPPENTANESLCGFDRFWSDD